MREVILDLDDPAGYRGLGDAVLLAWLAETARQGDMALTFCSRDPNKIKLLSMLRQKQVADPQGAMTTASIYQAELAGAGQKPRFDLLKEGLGLPDRLGAKRPELRIPGAARLWAQNTQARVTGSKSRLVMLFPGACFKSRQYPLNYWSDIAWKLHNQNIACIVLDSTYSDALEKFPFWFYGLNLENLAALVRCADLVVGNDSFPVHLAGTLGTPTVALLGPTSPNVYKHIPEVTTLASSQPDCTGCHFGKPFRAGCDLGCQSLFRLLPDEVLDTVCTRLNHE